MLSATLNRCLARAIFDSLYACTHTGCILPPCSAIQAEDATIVSNALLGQSVFPLERWHRARVSRYFEHTTKEDGQSGLPDGASVHPATEANGTDGPAPSSEVQRDPRPSPAAPDSSDIDAFLQYCANAANAKGGNAKSGDAPSPGYVLAHAVDPAVDDGAVSSLTPPRVECPMSPTGPGPTASPLSSASPVDLFTADTLPLRMDDPPSGPSLPAVSPVPASCVAPSTAPPGWRPPPGLPEPHSFLRNDCALLPRASPHDDLELLDIPSPSPGSPASQEQGPGEVVRGA
jgi:hypothetical protein